MRHVHHLAHVSVLWLVCLPLLAQAGIVECVDADGRRAFQATPCAQGMTSRARTDMPPLNTMAPVRSTGSGRARAQRQRTARPELGYREQDVRACRAARQRVEAHDARMRTGYSAARSGALIERQRALKIRQAEACEGVPQHRWMGG